MLAVTASRPRLFAPGMLYHVIEEAQAALAEVKAWVEANGLSLNAEKFLLINVERFEWPAALLRFSAIGWRVVARVRAL